MQQTFQNFADGTIWSFDPDVIVTDTNGVYSFKTASGVPINVPNTLIPYTAPTPTPAQLLASAQSAQSTIVNASCAAAIIAPFTSSSLGSVNTYGCNSIDQENINLVAAHGGSLWVLPNGGNWTFTAHTMVQGVQVQTDMLAHIQAQQTIYAGLLAQINTAPTVSAVQSIVWP
jgi:hypothetical protein